LDITGGSLLALRYPLFIGIWGMIAVLPIWLGVRYFSSLLSFFG
jgi:hypothetical protein